MREYRKPTIYILPIDHDELLQDMKVSNHEGYHPGGPGAKPGDDEWEEDDESITNKWDNLVPDNLPGTWQPVGE